MEPGPTLRALAGATAQLLPVFKVPITLSLPAYATAHLRAAGRDVCPYAEREDYYGFAEIIDPSPF